MCFLDHVWLDFAIALGLGLAHGAGGARGAGVDGGGGDSGNDKAVALWLAAVCKYMIWSTRAEDHDK